MTQTKERFEQYESPFDMYEVSNFGYIRHKETGEILPKHVDKQSGREYVRLERKVEFGVIQSKVVMVARAVADYFLPNEFDDKFVGFKDGDRSNNHVDNLFYAPNIYDSNEALIRPLRKETSEKRSELCISIHNAVESDNWKVARELGIELWELEGADWNDRNKNPYK